MIYSADCFEQGTLTIKTLKFDSMVLLRSIDCVRTNDLQKFVEKANEYDFIERPNGKTELGKTYTIRKAKNDFK